MSSDRWKNGRFRDEEHKQQVLAIEHCGRSYEEWEVKRAKDLGQAFLGADKLE